MALRDDEMTYNRHGQVVRTAPGAPSSSLNDRSSLTDPLKWANTFKNSQTGRTTSQQSANTLLNTDPRKFNDAQKIQIAGLTGTTPTITDSVLNAIQANPFTGPTTLSLATPFQLSAPTRQAPPPLTQLAGGMNHAQSWLDNVRLGMKRVAPYADPNKPWNTSWGQSTPNNSNSWASAFR